MTEISTIQHATADSCEDGSRRSILKCMLWAGAGVVWTVSGGVPRSLGIAGSATAAEAAASDLTFVQISDSHIGFSKEPNMDPTLTLQDGIDHVRQSSARPSFLIHTGDVTQLSKPAQFDTAEQIIKGAGLETHYVPGEHDVMIDGGKPFFDRFDKGGPNGWYSFDQNGVHFIALVNVLNLKPGGLGMLGAEQLVWVKQDLASRSASTPIVVFAHVPLWSVYPQWGWGTDDSAALLTHLKRFGSVTVLNGHIHQVMQKVEGNCSFYTAASTAFPQPAPGTAPRPGPITVPAEKLKSVLGIRTVNFIPGRERLAIIETPLGV